MMYPSDKNGILPPPFIIKELKRIGISVIITNDAHSSDKLIGSLDQSMELIKLFGFDGVIVMTDHCFDGVKS